MAVETPFAFADAIGPARVIHVREPSVGLQGTLVVDNVSAGPAIGGLRMAPDVSTGECARLARAMTLKNAAAGLPHGGAKSVLYGDPKMPAEAKERLVRAMACALRDCRDYIFGPDMGTNEVCMAWVREEIGRAVGLPREIGGIPLDEVGATGWGVRQAAEIAAEQIGLELDGARAVIQGFGAVGTHAARFLSERGVAIVAVGDSRGAIEDARGLDVDALIEQKRAGRSVWQSPDGKRIDLDALLDVECEIWIPAARPDVIDESNAGRLRTRLVVSGANIPMTPGAERLLHERGIVCVPDFIANAGGVICAAMEYAGATQGAAFQAIEERVRTNTAEVLVTALSRGEPPRQVAEQLGRERIERAMSYRRWGVF